MTRRTLALLLTLGALLSQAADKPALNLTELERDRVAKAADAIPTAHTSSGTA